jgi:hypothetical protein
MTRIEARGGGPVLLQTHRRILALRRDASPSGRKDAFPTRTLHGGLGAAAGVGKGPMPNDPWSGPCSRCGRQIDLKKDGESTLVGIPAKRVCQECMERERRQKAALCRICEHEVENPEGLEGPICSKCYGLYLSTSWAILDGLVVSEAWEDIKNYFSVTLEPSARVELRMRLANLRMNVKQHEHQHLERFPMVVRERRP